ncbi:hypothetical protein B566_EDAN007149 [Ephemera danica]|nr:hypothetical protein B566_EDAN007149 [Ephemera danica]
MLRKFSPFLFVVAVTLMLLLNLYHLQDSINTDTRLEVKILEGVRALMFQHQCPEPIACPEDNDKKLENILEKLLKMKCPECENKPCPEQVSCASNTKKPSDVIKMREMTSVLNSRDQAKEAIFFTETSGTGMIKPRFVCGVESAARVYTNADVYLLVAYTSDELQVEKNEVLRKVLRNYSNIQILFVDFNLLFTDTPLENFYKSGKLNSSKYRAAHTSDVLRFLTLWLYGGKYFDLDIITVKNLTGLDNFIIDESQLPYNYIATGAFAYQKHSPVGDHTFDILSSQFNGDEWVVNGPRVITEAMKWYTGAEQAKDMNEHNLKEFTKLAYEQLFPIEFFELLSYFNESRTNEVMVRINGIQDLFGIHIGNHLMKNDMVVVGSNVAYSLLAQKYCPRSYWNANAVF